MLTRELTEVQQSQVNKLEQAIIHKKMNEKKREKKWLKSVPPMGSDDEFEEDIETHVVKQYSRRQALRDNKYLEMMRRKSGSGGKKKSK